MKKYFLDTSVISLLISNIIIIILAVAQKWDVTTVLWVYWMQSIIIGFFQFLRILSLKNFSTENFQINNQSVTPTLQTKTFTAFFFLFHYGFFHFIYAIFLFNFFTNQPLNFIYLFTGGLIFFLNHTFSYFHNRIIDQQKIQNIGQLMFSPYKRIIPMHLIIIFGVILSQSTLIVFLLLKTIVDLVMHIFKHQEYQYGFSRTNN
ncbi:hypothetical protein HYS93_04070 [Candidatus Daviesbacteria bacterium]|nr:hypothetical protein [Candidatus Daviesbacteria bacterium]